MLFENLLRIQTKPVKEYVKITGTNLTKCIVRNLIILKAT